MFPAGLLHAAGDPEGGVGGGKHTDERIVADPCSATEPAFPQRRLDERQLFLEVRLRQAGNG